MPIEKNALDLDEINATERLIPFGDSDNTLTEEEMFLFYCDIPNDKCIVGIGDFSVTPPFTGTNSLDKGIHVRNANPAIVLEDTGGSLMSIQAGAGKKWYLKDETNNDEMFSVDNSNNILFPNAPNVEIGDGTSTTRELALRGANGLSISSRISFNENGNAVLMDYNSDDNCLDFLDKTGGSVDSTPILRIDRSRDEAVIENLALTERSSDPSNPSEGMSVIWQSDGTGSGADGDIMIKITAGGTTKTVTLVDFSAA